MARPLSVLTGRPPRKGNYFIAIRNRPDRDIIQDELGGRYLRVILLSDGETVHNAFFDRGFKP